MWKARRFSEARLHAVSSRNMYSEHGLEATDRPRGRAGVPVVDGGVELQAGIGDWPRRRSRSSPTGRAAFTVLATLPGLVRQNRSQSRIGLDGLEEVVGDAHRVVGVLAGDREIGFRIPVGVVDREIDVLVALLGELDDALDVIVRHVVPARRLDLAAQHRVLLRIEAVVAGAFAVHAGLEDRLQVLLVDLASR